MNPIDQAIQEAQNQAATQTSEVAVAAPAPTAVAVAAPPPVMSLSSMVSETTVVDVYLKAKEAGLILASAPTKYQETIEVIIDCKKITPSQVVKFGNPAVYLKTFDGVTCASGGTWQDALAKAQSIKADVTPYKSVDLAMTLVNDIKDVAEAGTVIGHSTATTNWNNFAGLFDKVMSEGGAESKIKVELGFEIRKSKDYEWPLITFKLLEVLK